MKATKFVSLNPLVGWKMFSFRLSSCVGKVFPLPEACAILQQWKVVVSWEMVFLEI